ncbi:MAG: TfuA-like protein [Acidimicrobiales bacterium]
MSASIAVFLGPSLSTTEAIEIAPDCTIHPPAACGDVYRVAATGPDTIVLIDGLFESVRSVWHKELLWALQAGIRVIGASSMGALRAAECAAFGMEPIGRIANDYLAGNRSRDGDVAVAHREGDGAWSATSVPLVNVEATSEAGAAAGAISDEQRVLIDEAAAQQFYAERTWPSIIEAVREVDAAAAIALEQHLADNGVVDQKAEDARAALRAAIDPRNVGTDGTFLESWRLSETGYWSRAQASFSAQRSSSTDGALVAMANDELRLDPEQHRRSTIDARLRLFARRWAGAAGVRFDAHMLAETRAGLDQHLGTGWVDAPHFDETGVAELVEAETAFRWADDRSRHEADQDLFRISQLCGLAGDYATRARDKAAVLDETGTTDASVAVDGDAVEVLRWWLESLGRSLPSDLAGFLADHGYDDLDALLRAVRRERAYREQRQSAPPRP